ncbi:MAG: transporter substrate-binding domain-containing protein, partial [Burkholderiales bacterium]
ADPDAADPDAADPDAADPDAADPDAADPDTRAQIAPEGSVRAGFNLANFMLVQRAPDGALQGIAVDLATGIARALGRSMAPVCFDTPGELAEAAQGGGLDLCFMAPDPARARGIRFSVPYLEVEATYLVPPQSALESIAAADSAGVRIGAVRGSGYALFLERHLRAATLVLADTHEASLRQFDAERLDALAGLRPRLAEFVQRVPGARLLEGGFTAVPQAIGLPEDRRAALAYVDAFLRRTVADGRLEALIEHHGLQQRCRVPALAARKPDRA